MLNDPDPRLLTADRRIEQLERQNALLADACRGFLEKYDRQGLGPNLQLEKFDTDARAMRVALEALTEEPSNGK